MRLDRLLAITIFMINRKMATAQELADHFNVSVRTIYRDIASITTAGIPIVAFPGVKGGFHIMNNYRLDKQVFNLSDMTSILSALKSIQNSMAAFQIDRTIEKITTLIPSDKESIVQDQLEHIIVSHNPWFHTDRHKEILALVHKALIECYLMKITYLDANSKKTERIIEPMSLVLKNFCWYIYAYCRTRSDYRLFRLSRVCVCKKTDEHFKRRKKQFHESEVSESWQYKGIDLLLRFSNSQKHFLEDHFDPQSISYQKNGTVLVSLTMPEDTWLYGMLLSFGDEVEVLKPEHIRTMLKQKALAIASLYNC